MSTRHRLQLGWVFLFGAGGVYELLKLTVWRVNPKREEHLYLELQERYGDNMPESVMQQTAALREMRDTLTLHNALKSPTPGEVCGALQKDFDTASLGHLRKM